MDNVSIIGVYRDRLIDPAGTVLRDSGWTKNLIVLRCRVLLAGFLCNDSAAVGIQSMNFGRGDPSWDTTPASVPDPSTTVALVDQSPFVVPVANLSLQYLDQADRVAGTATNRIQISATLGPNEPSTTGQPPFPLREFGLFGKFAAEPFMIDYIRHPLIEKDPALTLERRVRLIL